ncbi:MAG: O-antigen ligase family protein, partial [Deltaproteobacteria bacterium]|nr:O-antigen ligase family protein [Deltaproteobacteria bacterium]
TSVLIVVRHCRLPYEKKIPAGLIGAYFCFICLLIPSLLFSQNLRNDVRPFVNIVFDVVPFLLAWFGIVEKKQIIPLIAALAFSLTISSLSIIYQGIVLGVDSATRFSSFGYICMATAGFTAVILPLLGVVVLERRGLNPWLKAGLTAAIFIGVLAVVINMNRGVWMAMIIVTIIYLWVKLREKSGWNVAVLILLSCSIIIITLVPPFRDRAESVWNDGVSLCRSYQLIFKDNPTDEFNKIVGSTGKMVPERIYMWNGAWRMFHEHPWNGVGLGSVGEIFQSGRGYISPLAYSPAEFVHAHNNFLQFLAAAGIPGLLGFVILFIFVLWMSIRRYIKFPETVWNLAGLLVTVSFLIQGLTEYNYVHSALVRLYWFIFGICMVASCLHSDSAGIIRQKTEGNFA